MTQINTREKARLKDRAFSFAQKEALTMPEIILSDYFYGEKPMAVNNVYYVDMEKRYLDYQNGAIDIRNLHPMVYDDRNVALAVRQLGQSPGRMTPGPDGSMLMICLRITKIWVII